MADEERVCPGFGIVSCCMGTVKSDRYDVCAGCTRLVSGSSFQLNTAKIVLQAIQACLMLGEIDPDSEELALARVYLDQVPKVTSPHLRAVWAFAALEKAMNALLVLVAAL